MEFEQALEFVNRAFNSKIGRSLNEVEVTLLFGAWSNLTYDRIAEQSGYSINYLQRDTGPKFWKLLSTALGRKVNKTTLHAILTHIHAPIPHLPFQVQCLMDWGEALDVSTFHGRVEEIEQLTQWMIHDRCRLIAIVGMGGIGKSVLAAKVAQQLQEQFEFVIWRSLRNAPPLETLLAELVLFLSRQQDIQATPERLLYWLQTHRCLVILDNQDTLLKAGERAGYYQSDYTNYGDLFQLLGKATHQSCILLTSREKSAEVAFGEDSDGSVRVLSLKGSWEAALALIDAKGLVGSPEEKHYLCELYRCHPLALKMVATSIQSLFNGQIAAFLQIETPVFNGIWHLLEQQLERLSPVEKTIMYWLAINREWTTIAQLQADIVPAISRSSLLESLESLTWRSLIEKRVSKTMAKTTGEYTQQPVIMEYFTDCLIHQLATELLTLKTAYLNCYALMKTTVVEYIRESQIRLILNPLIEQLKVAFNHNSAMLEQHLQSILSTLRSLQESTFGYGVGNFINLCLHLKIDLAGFNFSHTTIRYADFQGATLQYINFQAAHFTQCIFTQIFTGGVWVGFSRDGQRFAFGDTNGGLHIWQLNEIQPLIAIPGHQGWVMAADWHPDGTTLVSGVKQAVRLWDTHTGHWLRDFHGCPDPVCTLAWSPDGKRLAGGGQAPFIILWDGTTGKSQARIEIGEPSCWVWSLVWLANGTVLAGACTDNTIKFWNVASGDCIQTIKAHDYWVLSLALHPNGRILASSGFDKAIKLWDWQTGECLQAIATQEDVWRLEWSPDGDRLAGGSFDHTVTLWDCSLKCLQVLQGHQSWVWSVTWSRDGNTLVSVSHDQVVKLWNTQTGNCIKTLRGYSHSSWCVRWSKDGIRLLSSGTNYMVQLWNNQTGECLKIFRGHGNEVMFVAWSPDERLIASASTDNTIRIWDIQTGQCLSVLQGHHSWVRAIAWSRDGNYLMSGSNDRTVKLWDIQTGQCLLSLSGHTHQVNSIVWFGTGLRAASASLDGTIRFWDLNRGVCDRIIGVNHSVHPMALSPDGNVLVSGDYGSNIKFWDVVSGDCLKTWQDPAFGSIFAVAWSPDGNKLASASANSTIKIWSVSTGECEQVIQGKNYGLSVDWNPVNQLLAIGFLEQPIQLWDIQMGKTIKLLQSKPPYEGMNITEVTGISSAQKATLRALGAIET
ncbi:NB-ARC domain-containing protein [Nostoc sp. 106C]|uniref:WD40 domain-containing protein n=1 Tax=Nostoc sp. 106C TaxID=1932667 RepID=UPI000A370A62|nr:NB-ARC domain-containing protein [Nostoc sp. 106C]OUL36300.1 hypothetical protein BV375_00405 [Nostoc sp. 106C]